MGSSTKQYTRIIKVLIIIIALIGLGITYAVSRIEELQQTIMGIAFVLYAYIFSFLFKRDDED